MSHHLPHHLKRLQINVYLNSHNHHTNSFDHRSRLPNDEAIRETLEHFTVPASNNTKLSRPFKPGPQRARRGGGRSYDRHWHPSLPKRAINYDLAESFMDHSTNPLSSELYKIKFKHSAKQWPDGRFMNYKEKLDKLDGNIIEINCTRTFPLIPKRKKIQEIKQNEQQNITESTNTISLLPPLDPIVQEEKKKQVNKQTNIYANLFGGGRIPRVTSNTQNKKSDPTIHSTSSSAAVSLLDEPSKSLQT